MKKIFISAAILSLSSMVYSEESTLPSSEEITPAQEELSVLEADPLELEKELLTIEQELLTEEEIVPIEMNAQPLVESPSIETISQDSLVTPIIEAASLEESTPLPETTVSAEENWLPLENDTSQQEPVATLLYEQTEAPVIEESPATIQISMKQVFAGSPWIYSALFSLSFASLAIWMYSMLRLQSKGSVNDPLYRNLRNKLISSQYEEAQMLCSQDSSFFGRIVSAGLSFRQHGLPTMLESMKAEGKRATISSWQRLGLLQDIAIIAPMLGLLGTVLGMFYAFYDLNRSAESMTHLFDGLGISVGTTVAGILVAILALSLHSLAKFRLVKSLAKIENEAVSLAHLMDERK